MEKTYKELMRWGKLQGDEEPDRSKTQSSKKRERTPASGDLERVP